MQDVLQELGEVSKEWFFLGLALELKSPTMEKIKDENDRNINYCKYEMVKAWLNGIDGCLPPTWANLVCALKTRTVGLCNLAENIGKKFC